MAALQGNQNPTNDPSTSLELPRISKNHITFLDGDKPTPAAEDDGAGRIHMHDSRSGKVNTALSDTSTTTVLFKKTRLRQPGADFEESILDIVLRLFGKARLQHLKSDAFEDCLRQRGERFFANAYHQLSAQPAVTWQGLFSCRILDESYFDQSISDFFVPDDYNGSVSDLFARTFQRLQSLKSATNSSAALCSIIMNQAQAQRTFSFLDLFAATASPYPVALLFALGLCSYLLFWSGCLDDTSKIIKSSLVLEEKLLVSDIWNLVSESALAKDLFGKGSYECTHAWAYKPPVHNVVQYATRQPFKQEPNLEKVQMIAQRNDNGSWCVTMLFKTPRIHQAFESLLKSEYERLRETGQCINSTGNIGALHVYVILFTLYKQINTELLEFMKQANIEARGLAVEARENPARSMFLHMSVLADYALMSKQHLKASQNHLCGLDLTGYPAAVQELKISIQRDIRSLLVKLQKTTQQLKEYQSDIKMFSEMKAAQTAGIMAVLVAIYVPFAGVAGYLGMNTVGIANGSIDTNVFWEAAIPLTIGTILLPLSATVIARLTIAASFSTRIFARRNWPRLIDFSIISTIVAIAIAHIINWRTRTDGYFVQYFQQISPYESVVTNSVLAALELAKTIEHVFERNLRAKMWFGLFSSACLLCVVCAAVGGVFPGRVVTLVLPIVWIICVSAFIRPGLGAIGLM